MGFLVTISGHEVDINHLTALTLLVGSVAGAAAACRVGSESRLFWWLAALGALYLAADEQYGLHERLGMRLTDTGFQAPGFHDADGVVMIGYGIAALAVGIRFRRELLEEPRVLPVLGVGAMATLGAFLLDDFGSNHGFSGWMEERLEWLASLCIGLALATRWRSAGRLVDAGHAATSVPADV